jgi:cysteine desulfurase
MNIDLQSISLILLWRAPNFMDQKELVLLIFENSGLQPLFFWGTRKGLRAGTEALHQIAGMAKALNFPMPT